MLTNRRIQILKAIVDEFVQTAEPVGSKTLMEKYNLPYSSATIRNDMQYLEEVGYLEKMHTSSGRIPSTLGYKFYCEHLMENKVDPTMEYALQQIYNDDNMNVESVIQATCNVLSQMTNLTTGVLGPDAHNQRLEHVKLFPISDRSAVCVFITDNGYTETKNFQFEEAISVDDIQNCCDILNDRLKGSYINDLVDKMETGNLGLEEMITLYAEGSRLVSQCEEKLRSAEGKIRELMEKNEKLTLKKEVES